MQSLCPTKVGSFVDRTKKHRCVHVEYDVATKLIFNGEETIASSCHDGVWRRAVSEATLGGRLELLYWENPFM